MGTNNKLREAVALALSLLDLEEGVPSKTVSQKDIDFMKAALAEPVKNCEVGTAEEQAERFSRFCLAQRGHCDRCVAFRRVHNGCVHAWAQMPYGEKEGGAK